MSEKVKARPVVRTGGAAAFIQEAQKSQKLQYVGFEEGKCHRRIILMSKVENKIDEKTNEEVQVTVPGYAVLHMFSEFMGSPVINPGYSDEGIELQADYTRTMYDSIVGDILTFNPEEYEAIGTVDLKTAYANFIRYVENFSLNFDPSKNQDRQAIMYLSNIAYEDNLEDPTVDNNTAIIRHFQEKWKMEVGRAGKYSDIFLMTFLEAVKTWMLDNTSFKIAFTPTGNANFSSVPFYGALADPLTEEGEHQDKVLKAVSSVARVLSQKEFEETDKSEGLVKGTENYFKIYNEWVNEPRTNRQLVQRPTLNGVIFIFDGLSDEICKNMVKDKHGSTELRERIHGVSASKLEKMKQPLAHDSVLENPDFVDVVFKYTTGSSKAQMGLQMSVSKWEGGENTRLEFKKIANYIDQTNSPNIADRINSYQPFPFEDFMEAFRRFLESKNSKGQLDFIKEDEEARSICQRGFEYLGFDLDSTSVSVEDILAKGGAGANPMAGMAANLGINFAGTQPQVPTPQPETQPQVPTPQPQPETQDQQPVMPQPTEPQPAVPQPEVQAQQPVMPQPTVPQPDMQAQQPVAPTQPVEQVPPVVPVQPVQ